MEFRRRLGEIDIESSKEEIVVLLKLFVHRIIVKQYEQRGSKTVMLIIHWNPALITEVINKKIPERGSSVDISGSGTGKRDIPHKGSGGGEAG